MAFMVPGVDSKVNTHAKDYDNNRSQSSHGTSATDVDFSTLSCHFQNI